MSLVLALKPKPLYFRFLSFFIFTCQNYYFWIWVLIKVIPRRQSLWDGVSSWISFCHQISLIICLFLLFVPKIQWFGYWYVNWILNFRCSMTFLAILQSHVFESSTLMFPYYLTLTTRLRGSLLLEQEITITWG